MLSDSMMNMIYLVAIAYKDIGFPFLQFFVCGFPSDNSQRVRKLAVGRTRFMITSLTAHFTRIAVGDCRDGILFYSYHEVSKFSLLVKFCFRWVYLVSILLLIFLVYQNSRITVFHLLYLC